MKFKIAATVFLISVFVNAVVGMSPLTHEGAKPELSVIQSDTKGYTVEINFPDPEFSRSFMEGVEYDKLFINGCGISSETGLPELPRYTKLVRLPNTGGYNLNITHGNPEIFKGLNIIPAQILRRDNPDESYPFVKDDNYYSQNKFYPQNLIEKGDIAIWRDIRVAPINVSPFQYNPATGELKFYNTVQVEIQYTSSGENELQNPRSFISEAFAPMYEELSIGPGGEELDLPSQRGAYLIITTPVFYDSIQYFADWKNRMGFHTYVTSTNETGTQNYEIKQYIIDAYNDWEVPPDYVLLVGDLTTTNTMPSYYVQGQSYQCPTDLPFTTIVGTDYFPEMFIGRLPIQSLNQLGTVLNKIDNYEKEPFMAETDWYDRALVIADFSGPESVRYTKDFAAEQLEYEGYGTVTKAYYPGSATSLISQTISNGVAFVNYRGYGGNTYWTMNTWTNWDVGNVYALGNINQTPVVTSMVCGGGNFSYSGECFGEAWIRSGSPTQAKGAVAFCGPSELYTHTKWNNNLDCGLYWGMFRAGINNFAPALLYAKMELWLDYPHNREGVGTGNNSVGFYFHVYNIFGDPSLKMWTRQPQSLTVDYQNPISLGMNQFTITVSDSNGVPIPDAYVCILKEDVSPFEIYEGGPTDESGQITLPLSDYTTGTMKLTVTGKNLIPLLQDVQVVSDDIVLGISAFEIDDDNIGGTSGNNDNMVSPAETINVGITVKNYGTSVTGAGITGTLFTASPKITITQGTGNFGSLNPGAESTLTYSFEASSDLISVDELGMTLRLSCSQGTWLQVLWAEISDAEFMPLEYEYLPATLEPGGQADVILTLQNTGLCNANGITANIVSLDPLVNVLSGASNFGNINCGATGDNSGQPFTLSAAQNIIPGHLAHLKLNFQTIEGYTPSSDLILTIGTVDETDPLGPDAYGYYCFDSGDTGYEKAPAPNTFSSIRNLPGADELDLPDTGDEHDCRVLVDLPFTFTFYGEAFDEISVCSNGFISMGDNENVVFRNKAIPSAMGPPNMIAGFWDDLHRISGESGYYVYYSSTNHMYYIEYYDVKNDVSNTNERFQIILYDPAFYPTPTGDGEIEFRYDDINDIDNVDNYSTVGIEDRDHTTGLQYVFSDIYHASSQELHDDLTLLFTTDSGIEQTPNLVVTLTPVNPPITIPAGGGTFSFVANVANNDPNPMQFDFWTEADLPSGSTVSPIFLRSGLNLAPGGGITRTLSQNVPASAPAGQYTFRGIVGTYPDVIISTSIFTFDKDNNITVQVHGSE